MFYQGEEPNDLSFSRNGTTCNLLVASVSGAIRVSYMCFKRSMYNVRL